MKYEIIRDTEKVGEEKANKECSKETRKMTKRYPFSISKVHNIELVKYMAINQDNEDLRQECNEVLGAIFYASNGKVAFLDGKTFGKARELSFIGETSRCEMNRAWNR